MTRAGCMRAAAVFPGRREIGLVEAPRPMLASPTDVLLRILEVGVCGTDREIAAFHLGTPPAGSDHLVIGHEALAEVAEVGPAVAGLEPGDLVVPVVRHPCPHDRCAPCRAGRQDFCVTGDFEERGIRRRHGFMTELVVDDARSLHVVPAALREIGVLVEPLTIIEKALLQLAALRGRLPGAARAGSPGFGAGQRAVVLGAGPVGLLGAMALVVAGFDTYVYSREPASDRRADIVEAIGATYLSAPSEPAHRLATRVGSVDVVYEAAGSARLVFEVLPLLGANGVFVLVGVPAPGAPIEVDAHRLLRGLVVGNQIVLGTVNAGRDAYDAAVRDLALFAGRWPEAVGGLITGRHPIEAHRDLLVGEAGGIKSVVALAGRA